MAEVQESLDTDDLQIAVSGIELLSLASTFWAQTGLVYRTEFPIMDSETSGRTLQAFTNKITWIFATFVFGYVGAEGLSTPLHFNLKLTILQYLWVVGLCNTCPKFDQHPLSSRMPRRQVSGLEWRSDVESLDSLPAESANSTPSSRTLPSAFSSNSSSGLCPLSSYLRSRSHSWGYFLGLFSRRQWCLCRNSCRNTWLLEVWDLPLHLVDREARYSRSLWELLRRLKASRVYSP